MPDRADASVPLVTAYTLAVGAAGAALAYLASLPVFILTGPAILVSALSLMGVHFHVAQIVRDAALLMIGIGLGAGVTSEATDAVLRWPLAFAALAAILVLILLICRRLLAQFFGFDRKSATLAATPGHLSFVIGLGVALDVNVARVSIVQSVRVLALTLLVPFVALAFGVTVGQGAMLAGPPMHWIDLALLFGAALAAGAALKRLGAPAPLLIGGLGASSVAHLADLTAGVPAPEIALPAFLVLGTLIGARFTGVTLADLRRAFKAGLTVTVVSASLAVAAAIPVAMALGMPVAHVVVAFAPGGLETMIAMGAVLGANPGFVVACHVARLMILTVLTPALLRTRKGREET